jgi:biotin operon repressor
LADGLHVTSKRPTGNVAREDTGHGGNAEIVDNNQAAIDRAAAKADADDKRTLGSLKLTWLQNVMSAYPEIDNATFRVAACIAFAVNQSSRYARISSQAISDKTGVSLTQVKEARKKLREHGWLIWKRTRDANIYRIFLLPKNVNDIADRQTICRDRRNETRKARQQGFQDGRPADYLTVAR